MNQFFKGMIVMACLVIGLIFLRFWQKSRDRLFCFFAAAFWILGFNWLCLAQIRNHETETRFYVVQLAAFLLLIIGILDKNRSRPDRSNPQQ